MFNEMKLFFIAIFCVGILSCEGKGEPKPAPTSKNTGSSLSHNTMEELEKLLLGLDGKEPITILQNIVTKIKVHPRKEKIKKWMDQSYSIDCYDNICNIHHKE
ncbi:MAG: hypothetical protein H6621_12385 [Halobacteriovoraceae bacterium]|nr:hypothetical protein [Halobacteriovoraceae bacterium]